MLGVIGCVWWRPHVRLFVFVLFLLVLSLSVSLYVMGCVVVSVFVGQCRLSLGPRLPLWYALVPSSVVYCLLVVVAVSLVHSSDVASFKPASVVLFGWSSCTSAFAWG